MKYIKNSSENIPEAIRILKAGGIVAHPADTCYGLAADLMNPEAVKKAQKIKGRDGEKPMSIMIPAFMKGQIEDFAELDDFSSMVCDTLLPGPVTILVPKGKKIPAYFFPESPYIGIRIPYDFLTQDLLTAFQGPLITTSANLSGEAACATYEDVKAIFEEQEYQPDLILEGEISGDCLPSTVILIEDKKLKILREGPMTKGQIEGVLGFSDYDVVE
jgi:L-threonylcarbamoyladenylate synthase